MGVQQPFIQDIGDRVEYNGKQVRMVNGARLRRRAPHLEDHFLYGAGALNSAVPQNWVTTETGAATPWAPGAAADGGLLTCVTGATTANAEEVAGKNVGWKPSTMALNQRMFMELRGKFVGATTPTDGDFFFGFANAVTYASGLAFVVSATSTLTTSAPVEFCGFGYSSIPTSGPLFSASGNLIGMFTEKASVAPAPAGLGVVKDSNFHVYGVEIDSAGNATWYIDDKEVGSAQACITPTVALTPYIAAVCRNSHALTGTVDFISVGGDLE